MLTSSSFPLGIRDILNHVYNLVDFLATNIVEKFLTNHTECYKILDSHTEQYRNSFFVRTVSEWNQLEESHIRPETVNSFREAVDKCY